MPTSSHHHALQDVIDAGDWDAEPFLGRLAVVAHTAFLQAGFVAPCTGGKPASFRRRLLPEQIGSVASSLSLRYTIPDLLPRQRRRRRRYTETAVLRLCAPHGDYVILYGYLTGDGDRRPTTHWAYIDMSLIAHVLSGDLDETVHALYHDAMGVRLWNALAGWLARRLFADMCWKNSVVMPSRLTSLPDDLQATILSRLSGEDLAKVECTCTKLKDLVAGRELWKAKYMAVRRWWWFFSSSSKSKLEASSWNWKEGYARERKSWPYYRFRKLRIGRLLCELTTHTRFREFRFFGDNQGWWNELYRRLDARVELGRDTRQDPTKHLTERFLHNSKVLAGGGVRRLPVMAERREDRRRGKGAAPRSQSKNTLSIMPTRNDPLHIAIDAVRWDAEPLLGRLVAIAHATFLDAGFVPCTNRKPASRTRHHLPEHVGPAASSLSLRYTIPELLRCGHTATGVETAVLRLCGQGDNVIFYGYLTGDGNRPATHWACIDAPFVALVLSGDLDATAHALSHDAMGLRLWRALAGGLSRWLFADICQKSHKSRRWPQPPQFTSALPTELQVAILSRLAGEDLAKVECTCTELRDLIAGHELWKVKCIAARNWWWLSFCFYYKTDALSWKEKYLKSRSFGMEPWDLPNLGFRDWEFSDFSRGWNEKWWDELNRRLDARVDLHRDRQLDPTKQLTERFLHKSQFTARGGGRRRPVTAGRDAETRGGVGERSCSRPVFSSSMERSKHHPLHDAIDAGDWDAEPLLGRLVVIAHAAFLHTGFIPCAGDGDRRYLPDEIGAVASKLALHYTTRELLEIRDERAAPAATTVGADTVMALRLTAVAGLVILYGYISGDGVNRTTATRWASIDASLAAPVLAGDLDATARALSDDDDHLWKELAGGLVRRLFADMATQLPSRLMLLPAELQLEIMRRLAAKELVHVVCTCMELRDLVAVCKPAIFRGRSLVTGG
uniref:F-box domain-containing protein n=1 Tax=Leersia perrieri TaxID=77586 RepID=A0A0D9XHK1_9ORYZ